MGFKGRRISVGHFVEEEEAARAYDYTIRALNGSAAVTNLMVRRSRAGTDTLDAEAELLDTMFNSLSPTTQGLVLAAVRSAAALFDLPAATAASVRHSHAGTAAAAIDYATFGRSDMHSAAGQSASAGKKRSRRAPVGSEEYIGEM